MRPGIPIIADAADYERHFHDDAWQQAAAIICERHSLPYTTLRRSTHGENIIFFVDDCFIVKIYTPFRRGFEREKAALEFAHGKLSIETPEIIHAGNLESLSYIVMTQLKGFLLRDVWPMVEARNRFEVVSRLGIALRELHAHAAPLSEDALNQDWNGFRRRQAHASVERQRACGANPEWLESLPAFIAERFELLNTKDRLVMLHGDVHPGNLLLTEANGRLSLTGLCDFADSLYGFHEYEFVAPGVLMVQGNRELQRALLLSYGYAEAQLDLNLRARLMLLTVLYECSDLRKYALRLAPEAVHLRLAELEAAIWTVAAD